MIYEISTVDNGDLLNLPRNVVKQWRSAAKSQSPQSLGRRNGADLTGLIFFRHNNYRELHKFKKNPTSYILMGLIYATISSSHSWGPFMQNVPWATLGTELCSRRFA